MLRLAELNRMRGWRGRTAEMNELTEALSYVNTRIVQLEDMQTCSVGVALERMQGINQRYNRFGNSLVLMISPTLGCTDSGEFVQVSAFIVPEISTGKMWEIFSGYPACTRAYGDVRGGLWAPSSDRG